MKINSTVDKFVGIIIVVALFVAFIPTIITSFINLSGEGVLGYWTTDNISTRVWVGLPLANMFSSNGIVLLLLGVYVFYTIISGLKNKGRT